jgi:hypothetical protein
MTFFGAGFTHWGMATGVPVSAVSLAVSPHAAARGPGVLCVSLS